MFNSLHTGKRWFVQFITGQKVEVRHVGIKVWAEFLNLEFTWHAGHQNLQGIIYLYMLDIENDLKNVTSMYYIFELTICHLTTEQHFCN